MSDMQAFTEHIYFRNKEGYWEANREARIFAKNIDEVITCICHTYKLKECVIVVERINGL